jgi:hypothetical protein
MSKDLDDFMAFYGIGETLYGETMERHRIRAEAERERRKNDPPKRRDPKTRKKRRDARASKRRNRK